MLRGTWRRSVVASASGRWFRAPRKLRVFRIDEFSLLLFPPSGDILSRYSYLITSYDAFFFSIKSPSNICNDQRLTSSSIIYEKSKCATYIMSQRFRLYLSSFVSIYFFFPSILKIKFVFGRQVDHWKGKQFRLACVRKSIRSNLIWFTVHAANRFQEIARFANRFGRPIIHYLFLANFTYLRKGGAFALAYSFSRLAVIVSA